MLSDSKGSTPKHMYTEELLLCLRRYPWFLLNGPALIPKSCEDIYHHFLPWDLTLRRFWKGIKISFGVFLKIHFFKKMLENFLWFLSLVTSWLTLWPVISWGLKYWDNVCPGQMHLEPERLASDDILTLFPSCMISWVLFYLPVKCCVPALWFSVDQELTKGE